MTKDQTLERIAASGVVAVIRATSADQLPGIARALLDGGVICMEVTMTTPSAIDGIRQLAKLFGDAIIPGVGTVLDARTTTAAIEAGAEFVVSPVLSLEVIQATKTRGKVSIPGAFTPTEILTAWNAGADVVKVFPATALGPTYFKDLLAPMPFLKLTPTGGVDLNTIGPFIQAGAVAVGAGSSLISKEALTSGNWAVISATAALFTAAVQAARLKE